MDDLTSADLTSADLTSAEGSVTRSVTRSVRPLQRLGVVLLALVFGIGFAAGGAGAAVGQDPAVTTVTPTTVTTTTVRPTTVPPVTAPPTTVTTTTVRPTTVPPVTAPPTTVPPKPPAPKPPAPRPPAPDPAAKWLSHLNVSLGTQHVNAIARDGSLLWSFPMSSGAYGRTPRGTFHVYSRSSWTTASGDPSVSMQWMTRFRGGIGFHALPRKNGRVLYTPLGIRPVSHGCIRLADQNARWIYATVPNGTRVVVK